MKQATFVALRAILESDAPRTKADRDTLLATLGLNDNTTQRDPGDRIVSFSEAAQRMACTKRTLHNFVLRGALTKVMIPGATKARGFLASHIDALLANSVKEGAVA